MFITANILLLPIRWCRDTNTAASWKPSVKMSQKYVREQKPPPVPSWYVVNADIKKHARLNCIKHLLSMIDYEDLTPEPVKLEPRQKARGYVRPPMGDQTFVPEHH